MSTQIIGCKITYMVRSPTTVSLKQIIMDAKDHLGFNICTVFLIPQFFLITGCMEIHKINKYIMEIKINMSKVVQQRDFRGVSCPKKGTVYGMEPIANYYLIKYTST